MFITVADDDREEMISVATDSLRNYLKLLDELSGIGALVARRVFEVIFEKIAHLPNWMTCYQLLAIQIHPHISVGLTQLRRLKGYEGPK
jgi:hypothetical protein